MTPSKPILRWHELVDWLRSEDYSVRQIKRMKRLGHIRSYRFTHRPNGQCRYLTVQVNRDVVKKRLNVAQKRGRRRI